MLGHMGPSYYTCYIVDVRCIINGLFFMYKFGTRKTCTWLFGRLVVYIDCVLLSLRLSVYKISYPIVYVSDDG